MRCSATKASVDDVVFHALLNQFTPLLQLAICHGLGAFIHAKARLEASHVDFDGAGIDADLLSHTGAMALHERHGDVCEFSDDVKVGGKACDSAIEEHHVLHIEH